MPVRRLALLFLLVFGLPFLAGWTCAPSAFAQSAGSGPLTPSQPAAPANPASPPKAGASTAPPPTGAILPFVPLRKPDDAWIGRYLADVLRRRIETAGTVALLSQDAAAQHAARLNLEPLTPPTLPQWAEVGLDTLVVGTVQRVLNRVAVNVRFLSRAGDLGQPATLSWKIDLAADTPEAAAMPLLAQASTALHLPDLPSKLAWPEDWAAVEAVYNLAARAERAATAEERQAVLAELPRYASSAGLVGVVAELEALMRLEQAVLSVPAEARPGELKRAADAAQRAVNQAPADSYRRALLGEIHYFAKQDYLAKTEASVARIKNPLNGLAWAVLGLVAGPSTGEGTQQLQRARQADPFLWQESRAPGTLAFQGGLLDETLHRWAVQHDQSGKLKTASQGRAERAASKTLLEGIAAFEAHRWDEADVAFRKAADEDEYDYRPLLYDLRILIETGRSPEAVAPLRDLQAENPLEQDVLVYLGVALEKSGNLEDARQTFQRILQDDPQQPVALYHLGLTAMAAHVWQDALEPLRTLVGIQPRHEDAWLQLGIAQANLQQWSGADEAFRQVLSINPKSQPAREWRARIRSKLSR